LTNEIKLGGIELSKDDAEIDLKRTIRIHRKIFGTFCTIYGVILAFQLIIFYNIIRYDAEYLQIYIGTTICLELITVIVLLIIRKKYYPKELKLRILLECLSINPLGFVRISIEGDNIIVIETVISIVMSCIVFLRKISEITPIVFIVIVVYVVILLINIYLVYFTPKYSLDLLKIQLKLEGLL